MPGCSSGGALVGPPLVALIAFVWIGMIVGVSGLATPVKFTAPSLTRPVALEIGRLTFRLFSRIEWAIALLTFVVGLAVGAPRLALALIVAAGILLALQGAWLLPALNARATAIDQAGARPAAPHHRWYVLTEGAKLILLIAVGLMTI